MSDKANSNNNSKTNSGSNVNGNINNNNSNVKTPVIRTNSASSITSTGSVRSAAPVSAAASMNRMGAASVANNSADFLNFLATASSNMNYESRNETPGRNSTASLPSFSESGTSTPTNSSNASSKLDTIRQYYLQLSNNLRLITQQLQMTDLTPNRRQSLLVEQARANAAMHEFTEKILKPISISKQLQQPQQQQQQQQQQKQFRPPNNIINNNTFQNTSTPPTNNFNPQNQAHHQILQNSQKLRQHQQQQQPQRPVNSQNIGVGGSINNGISSAGNNGNFPSGGNVNLYSQSGLGMIRPILNSTGASNNSNAPNRTNAPINNGAFFSRPPSQTQQQQSQSQFVGTQSPQRPTKASNTQTFTNLGPAPQLPPQQQQSQMQSSQPPTRSQQLLLNRQAYLMAAQQHQTSVQQQQSIFQQRLALFTRDSVRNVSVAIKNKNIKDSTKAPVLALPPVFSSSSLSAQRSNSPSKAKLQQLQQQQSSFAAAANFSGRSSSFPTSYSRVKVKEIFQNLLSDGTRPVLLSPEAEGILYQIADQFIDTLTRKTCKFAIHRVQSHQTPQSTTSMKRKLTQQQQQQSQVQVKKRSLLEESHSNTTVNYNVVVDDMILGLDEVLNYQLAGSGSIQNCRPVNKKSSSSGGGSSLTNNSSNNSTTTSSADSSHQQRLILVKKHSQLFLNYQQTPNPNPNPN